MTRRRHPALPTLAIAALAVLSAPAAMSAPTGARSCFAANSWQGWRATGDGDALYLRVGLQDIYRVDLTPGSHVRKHSDEFLVSQIRGSNWICGPLDLDLTLSDHQGFRRPLIATSLRKLSPDEVAAIPRKDLP